MPESRGDNSKCRTPQFTVPGAGRRSIGMASPALHLRLLRLDLPPRRMDRRPGNGRLCTMHTGPAVNAAAHGLSWQPQAGGPQSRRLWCSALASSVQISHRGGWIAVWEMAADGERRGPWVIVAAIGRQWLAICRHRVFSASALTSFVRIRPRGGCNQSFGNNGRRCTLRPAGRRGSHRPTMASDPWASTMAMVCNQCLYFFFFKSAV